MIRNRVNWKTVLLFLALLCVVLVSCGKDDSVTISSPDGLINVEAITKGGENNNTLMYSITFNGVPILSPSSLGIMLSDDFSIVNNLNITRISHTSKDETYTMAYGKTAEITDRYNEATISLADQAGNLMDLIFRVYNDGVAFRYHFPEQNSMQFKNLHILDEYSGFNFYGDFRYWGLHLKSFITSYETDYTIGHLSSITDTSLVGLPVLVEIADNIWVALTEANLTDYAGMYLSGTHGNKPSLTTRLSPLPNESGIAVKTKTPYSTPWRVIMIADDPGRLVESNIVLNLNEPCAIDDSWIKPGKAAWDWWSGQVVKGAGFEGTMDNRTMKHYIDFAGDYGLEYMLVDAGWYGYHSDGVSDITTSIPQIYVPELVQYANDKGVDIILWLNWKCVDRQMDEAFALYERWGVKGVKVDYMNSDDQEMVNFYHRVVKKAAEHKLIVDFHGAYKPTGVRRTYPNLIVREGVMGLEYVKWSDRITPDHDCILPFTRMLAGPMDYTPGSFHNTTREQFKSQRKEPMSMGTRCHQLALFVVFESPLTVLCDHPGNYRNEPGIDFLKIVPVTWDDTKVIHGQVGDYVTIARRSGDEWYMGSITDWTPRELQVPLDFLGDGDYVAEIWADGLDASKNAESVTKSKVIVNADITMSVRMAPGGGHTVRFYPAPDTTVLPRYE